MLIVAHMERRDTGPVVVDRMADWQGTHEAPVVLQEVEDTIIDVAGRCGRADVGRYGDDRLVIAWAGPIRTAGAP